MKTGVLIMNPLAIMLLILASGEALAAANFVSNPNLPYPPGCAFNGAEAIAPAVEDEPISLHRSDTGAPVEFHLSVYRSACSEADRSLVWVRFVLRDRPAPAVAVELPVVVAETHPLTRWPASFVSTPNTWGENTMELTNRRLLVYDPARFLPGDPDPEWLFLLDAGAYDEFASLSPGSAEWYNGAFTLVFRYPPYDAGIRVDIPTTADMNLTPASLPLSGRLSGHWVIDGAADQGVVLAISGRVPTNDPQGALRHDMTMVVFLAHYTYDTTGDLLWLTGAANITTGSSVVDIPIERVSGGAFLAGNATERAVIGSVRLTVTSCDDVRFDYDYGGAGLGAGTERLQRLFSLETAGYDCRDYTARVAANH